MHNNNSAAYTETIWLLYMEIIYVPSFAEHYCRTSPVDECTFCITFSFKAEDYTESTLIHRGCLVVIFRFGLLALSLCILYSPFFLSCALTFYNIHSVKLHRIRTPYSPDTGCVLPPYRENMGSYSVEFYAMIIVILVKYKDYNEKP